jgi:zinc protease
MTMKKLLPALLALLVSQFALAGSRIEHWVSSAGTRVYFIASPNLPILDVQVDFAAGSMFDPAGKSGLAALTRATLDLGAGENDETAIAEQLADLGAQLGGAADTDRASIQLRTLSMPDKRDPALAILRAVLHAPQFNAAVLEREKARTVASLKEALTRPESIAGQAFWTAMYPSHPYGRQATPESVACLSRDDLKNFYDKYYVTANTNITLVGNISRTEAEAIAESLSQGLATGAVAALPPPPVTAKGSAVKIAHPASQSHIYIGLPAIERGNPDYFPLLVGNYTLGGGGFVSRLVKEIRDKRGYVYSVYSHLAPLRQAGPFQIGLQTKRSQAREATRLARNILEAFLKSGPSEEELAAAKDNLAGSFPLRLDSNKKLLDNAALIGFYGLPLDYLEQFQAQLRAVTAEQVKQAFARHIVPAKLITVTVAAD